MSRKIATRIRPAIAARHASLSESLPSVAEMSVRSSVSNLTGKAPVWSTSAMSFASCSESRPWICARPPPIPLDRLESVKSICGKVLISRSRTIAKCCGCWRSFPRIHSSRVMRSKASAPEFVNSIVTMGLPPAPGLVSKSARVPESFRSSPVICGMLGGSYLKR